MNGTAHGALVVLHVVSAVVGFGAVAVTGAYAAAARASPDPLGEVPLIRYFRPGTNWAARTLLVIPVFGMALVFSGHRSTVSEAWPWIGLGLWVVACGLASAVCWPAERAIQLWLAGRPDPNRGAVDLAGFRRACARAEWSAAAVSVCFVAAVVIMIAQPI